jgi:AcrR family transcriptional regulator
MPRTSTPRGDVAKERILQHAVQIFSMRGFDGFTTRELSAKAKVNIAAINYYFGHKQGLYDAAVDEVYRRLKERGNQVFATEVAPRLFAQVTAQGPPQVGAAGRLIDLEQVRFIIKHVYTAARQEAAGIRLIIRQVLDAGHLSSHTESQHFLPGTEMAAGMISTTLGITPERARANMVAFGFLLSRYVVQDEKSLVTAFGVKTPEEAEARVIDTLVSTIAGGSKN